MEILAFDRSFDRSLFSCGKPDLDNWLKTQAGQEDAGRAAGENR
jgi:hypothetical protein